MISFKDYITEAIKGWKHAHSDIAKARSAASSASNDVKLVRLKKDGKESGMHDATKTFKSEDEARAHHKRMTELNPGKGIAHNLYVGGEHKEVLKEETELDEANVLLPGSPKNVSIEDAITHHKQKHKDGMKQYKDLVKQGQQRSANYAYDVAEAHKKKAAYLTKQKNLGNYSAHIKEETGLDEVAKPKGIVDKNVGKPEKESKSGFKTGQRVAHYRGMGKTLHGNVTNPDASSGGKKGAMVKFQHGTEFVPHKELKDASEYWKTEEACCRVCGQTPCNCTFIE